MTKLLEGKVAAITGAATGIGRAIALEYLRQGASVVVNHFDDAGSESQFQSLAEEAQAGSKLIASAGDISKPETAERLVADAVRAFGKLDIFVSNAGVCKFSEFLS
jgi:L-rhamnose 1-dehydrogenase